MSDDEETVPPERDKSSTAGAEKRPKPTPYPRSLPQPSKPAPAPEPPPRRKRSRVRGAAKAVVALVSVAALAATGYAYVRINDVRDNVQTTPSLQEQNDPAAPPADDGATDILLVGADSRTDQQGNQLPLDLLKRLRTEAVAGVNTDTLIVLRIPKDGSKPSAVSIPRDTWVDIPERGKGKINSAFGVAKEKAAQSLRGKRDDAAVERESDQAGRAVLVKTVQDFTQIRLDHYAEIGLLGFYLLTEALGGVKVCLKHATEDKDSGASFRKGVQVVSGGEALSFVRQRKNLPGGDLGRIVRQQAFLSSALKQVLSAGTLADPRELTELTDVVRRSLVLDPDLDLLEFAQQARSLAGGNVNFVTIPVVAVGARSDDGQSIIEVDLPAVRQFVAGLAGRGAPTAGGGAAAGSAQASQDGVTCVD
ncbi:LCP family protein [Amycolatopsis suaedae]|uniref:LytR family transcriptional regulator n=1 Tax=Amycolatopsis suaedae TaxID=2510978 RepID=A0A4Q7J769_9PSEU|nr:LCP family protein [Amycolatopsis suaedae]RZQ62716.1 LytR family transcriptional regulator [Amycolatopsis suaedae]